MAPACPLPIPIHCPLQEPQAGGTKCRAALSTPPPRPHPWGTGVHTHAHCALPTEGSARAPSRPHPFPPFPPSRPPAAGLPVTPALVPRLVFGSVLDLTLPLRAPPGGRDFFPLSALLSQKCLGYSCTFIFPKKPISCVPGRNPAGIFLGITLKLCIDFRPSTSYEGSLIPPGRQSVFPPMAGGCKPCARSHQVTF